jgi:hypothetical protein
MITFPAFLVPRLTMSKTIPKKEIGELHPESTMSEARIENTKPGDPGPESTMNQAVLEKHKQWLMSVSTFIKYSSIEYRPIKVIAANKYPALDPVSAEYNLFSEECLKYNMNIVAVDYGCPSDRIIAYDTFCLGIRMDIFALDRIPVMGRILGWLCDHGWKGKFEAVTLDQYNQGKANVDSLCCLDLIPKENSN